MKSKFLLFIVVLVSMVAACGESATVTPALQELNVDAADVTLFVRIAGQPEAENVLIASGHMMLSSHPMVGLEELVSSDLAVVTFDPRGVGRSTQPPSSVSSYDLIKYVADLEAVRKAVGAESVHLFGHHWGGLVAMRYATLYPERVDSIILFGSLAPNSRLFEAQSSAYWGRVARMQQQALLPSTLPDLTCASILNEYVPVGTSDPGFQLPEPWQAVQCSDTALTFALSNLSDFDITPELANLDHQVLILYGEDDPHGEGNVGEAIKRSMSGAQVELVNLEKCGHIWEECATQFFSQVQEFLGLPKAPAP